MEQDLKDALKYLSEQGYGSGTDWDTKLVAVLLANYVNNQQKEDTSENELLIKSGRRLYYDAMHMLNHILDEDEFKDFFKERLKFWETVFIPDSGIKDYLTNLHYEIRNLNVKLAVAMDDTNRIDWIQSIMTPKDDYVEVFFAGLRNGIDNDASSFQIECNPEKFEVINATTLREAITKAMTIYKADK